MALLSLNRVTLSPVGVKLLDEASLNLEAGERACLLGRNGEGKSSLLRMVTGEISPQSGEIAWQSGARVASLPQEVPENLTGRVREIIADDGPDSHEIDVLLHQLQLDGDAEFSSLSGGGKRRTLLARALVAEPDVLLLDEPTNHLDIAAIAWLENTLKRFRGALLFVTHDRAFLQGVATRIVELDRGRLQNFDCRYDEYLRRKESMLESEAKTNREFDKLLAQEEVWVRRGLKARTTRNEGRVRALQAMRDERRARRNVSGNARVEIQTGTRSGHQVVEAENANFGYGEKILVRDFSTRIMRGDKIGIAGPNGAGKTTLLRLLLGDLEPQSGSIKQGTRLEIAYSDQMRASLNGEKSVAWNVAGENDTVPVGPERKHIVSYLGEWLFPRDRIWTKAATLSGGERNRLLLAKLFTQPANVLVLDEPTNDLDLETLELLEESLVNFPGTVLLVSHDRAFLNNVVTSILAPEGDGYWRDYVGGWDDYQRVSKQSAVDNDRTTEKSRAASEATKPRVAKARKLSFKETRELEELPAKLESLEAEHAKITVQMNEPDFWTQHAAQSATLTARLQELENQTLAAYARWEELEAVRIASEGK
ncbi:MAG TPA: ATP-binding cassette domain-containing protein [Abditibacteriaceae bacterium]|jgi:ATP-binding cassette subfamily F protein uup